MAFARKKRSRSPESDTESKRRLEAYRLSNELQVVHLKSKQIEQEEDEDWSDRKRGRATGFPTRRKKAKDVFDKEKVLHSRNIIGRDRRSGQRRAMDLEAAAEALVKAGKYALVITGAGISVASGVPAYRTGNGIWNQRTVDWGTIRRFHENPIRWWREYWIPTHETRDMSNAQPNRGHESIAELSQLLGLRIITQNVDGLHHHTTGAIPMHQLAEVHGRTGVYRCTSRPSLFTVKRCPFSVSKTLSEDVVRPCRVDDGNEWYTMRALPRCPACSSLVAPMALFFDENYITHQFFQWRRAQIWAKEAQAIFFVGTSFSVGVTERLLQEHTRRGIPAFSFNVQKEEPLMRYPNVVTVLGPCADTLDVLLARVRELKGV